MKYFYSFVLLILLSSCATIKPKSLSSHDSKSMQDKKLSITLRENAPMQYLTPYHVALMGLPAAITSIHQGNKIVASNKSIDPSIGISKELQAFLKEKLNLTIVLNNDSSFIETTKLEKIVNSFKGISDYVIDVYTTEWKLTYLSNNWSKYTIVHSSRMRLIDINNSQVVSEHSCRSQPNKIYSKEVLKNDSKIFNQELKAMVDACVNFYKKQSFSSLK